MKKILIIAIFTIVLITAGTRTSFAQNISDASATPRFQDAAPDFDFRAENLRKFLEKYNSPLSSYANEFVIYADEYNIDYRLVPAISGVESTFGKHIPVGSYNAYGWANGDYKFKSWKDSIRHVTFTLRKSYIDKGAPTIGKIARRYAPPSKTWGGKVTLFVSKIDTLPLNFDIVI